MTTSGDAKTGSGASEEVVKALVAVGVEVAAHAAIKYLGGHESAALQVIDPAVSRGADLVGGAVASAVRRFRQRRYREKFLAPLTGETSPERQDQALLELFEKGDAFTAAVLTGIDAALNAMTEAAIPVLADLLKQYRNVRPDAYFRSVANLMRAVSDSELRQLRVLARALDMSLQGSSGPEWQRVIVASQREREGEPMFLRIIVPGEADTSRFEFDQVDDAVAYESMLRLLDSNGFLTHSGGGDLPLQAGIYRSVASRLADLLGHGRAT